MRGGGHRRILGLIRPYQRSTQLTWLHPPRRRNHFPEPCLWRRSAGVRGCQLPVRDFSGQHAWAGFHRVYHQLVSLVLCRKTRMSHPPPSFIVPLVNLVGNLATPTSKMRTVGSYASRDVRRLGIASFSSGSADVVLVHPVIDGTVGCLAPIPAQAAGGALANSDTGEEEGFERCPYPRAWCRSNRYRKLTVSQHHSAVCLSWTSRSTQTYSTPRFSS